MELANRKFQLKYKFLSLFPAIIIFYSLILSIFSQNFNDAFLGLILGGLIAFLAIPVSYTRSSFFTLTDDSLIAKRIIGGTLLQSYSQYKSFSIKTIESGCLISFRGGLLTSIDCFVLRNEVPAVIEILSGKITRKWNGDDFATSQTCNFLTKYVWSNLNIKIHAKRKLGVSGIYESQNKRSTVETW